MKIKKKNKLIFSVILIVMFSFIGCAEKVSSEIKEDNVIIKDVDYQSSFTTTTYTYTGKVMIPISTYHPEEYNVIMEYQGRELILDNKEVYRLVRNRIGEEVKGTIEISHYSDNSTRMRINSIEDIEIKW